MRFTMAVGRIFIFSQRKIHNSVNRWISEESFTESLPGGYLPTSIDRISPQVVSFYYKNTHFKYQNLIFFEKILSNLARFGFVYNFERVSLSLSNRIAYLSIYKKSSLEINRTTYSLKIVSKLMMWQKLFYEHHRL